VVVSWLVCVGVGGDCQGGFTCLESWLVGGSVGRSIRKDGKFRGSDGSGRVRHATDHRCEWFHGMSGGGSRFRFHSEWLRLHN
jgi:hypothetical protein